VNPNESERSKESELPERSFTLSIPLPSAIEIFSEKFAKVYSKSMAEAQMLEHAIKAAIIKDIKVFAAETKQVSYLEALKKVTLGQAKNISFGKTSQPEHKAISRCIGFYGVLKMYWHGLPRAESELGVLFKDAVTRRNKIAHQLLAEIILGEISDVDAIAYLENSSMLFLELHQHVTIADSLSSIFGGVAKDGSSLPRAKATE
jgi:hypothetical protein